MANITKIDIGKRCIIESRKNKATGVGTIVDVLLKEPKVAVQFDEFRKYFHTCGGKCPNHYGYYIPSTLIEVSIDECISTCNNIW